MASCTSRDASLAPRPLRRHSSEIRAACANERPCGSVRGAISNDRPYRDRFYVEQLQECALVANKILERGSEYLVTLKANHGNMFSVRLRSLVKEFY